MNPKNIDVLKVFKVDVACLANNHILDFGQEGLLETIETLNKNGILTVGAGRNIEEAEKPAIFGRRTSKILIFNYADVSSGVTIWWKAEKDKAGVNLLTSDVPKLIVKYLDVVRPNIVIFSIHWGPNWGYEITKEQRNFAHRLIDEANVDLIFGHSSHHFKGIETYKGKFIIYGAGDFINDYEGIEGYEEFRGDLVLGYIWEVNKLTLLPFKIKKFRLNYCTQEEIDWIFDVLKRESKVEGNFILEEKRIIIKIK
jgi:poly-gamma-glutamate synthesis protein (capsule biosynthesis protein)